MGGKYNETNDIRKMLSEQRNEESLWMRFCVTIYMSKRVKVISYVQPEEVYVK